MVKFNIYFQDLKEDTQDELWVYISKDLIDSGLVEERYEEESEDEYLERVRDETDYYINTHNFAVPFVI